jgi:diguanylate cyclase
MFQSLFINVSMVISTLFAFFQFYFRYVTLVKWKLLRNIILGCAFGLAQVIFFKFPIHIDQTTVTLGKSLFITSALFGGIFAAIATLILFHGLSRLLPPMKADGPPPFPVDGMGPKVSDMMPPAPLDGMLHHPQMFIPIIDIALLLVCFFCLRFHWGRFQKWFLLNALFQVSFLMDGFQPPHASSFTKIGLEFLGSLFIYYFVSYMYRSHEDKRLLEINSLTDALTGLYNVRFFRTTFQKLFLNARNEQHELSLLLVDIDHFKKINDTYGHPAGDKVLIEIAEIMRSTCQGCEIVSRNGGEEFSILLPKINKKEALRLAEKLRARVEGHRFVIEAKTEPLKVTVSTGLSQIQTEDRDADELLQRTDEALYRAKTNGRNQVSC